MKEPQLACSHSQHLTLTLCLQCCGRHLNGFADRPPVRPNMSLGDTLAGLHAAFGIVMALLHRQRHDNKAPGQVCAPNSQPFPSGLPGPFNIPARDQAGTTYCDPKLLNEALFFVVLLLLLLLLPWLSCTLLCGVAECAQLAMNCFSQQATL